jgi:hypothetical protein
MSSNSVKITAAFLAAAFLSAPQLPAAAQTRAPGKEAGSCKRQRTSPTKMAS